jgi:dTDP-4-amino-4,6-dideoxygalactose transaminase
MGRALDVWFPGVVTTQPWWRRFHPELQRNLGLDYRSERRRNVESRLRAIAPMPASHFPALPAALRHRNISAGPAEDKPIDLDFVRRTLEQWGEPDLWTESGPVAGRLETAVADYLELPEGRVVVATKDGAGALFGLVGMAHLRAARPLRWLTCALGPEETRSGLLAEARLVDCDLHGVLDLGALRKEDPEAYDGVVVVDLFGRAGDLGGFVEFCSSRHKVLVVDGTAAFDSGRADRGRPPEALSFGHAVPWGVVEGGGVIVERSDEALVRAIIDGSAEVPAGRSNRLSTGMSDLNAAFALQRLRDFGQVAPRYDGQYQRVLRIARRFGFRPLLHRDGGLTGATPMCVPLVAPAPVPRERLGGMEIAVRLPFEVSVGGLPRARSLAERVLTVPAHPGLEGFSDGEIADVLERLVAAD